MNKQKCKSLSDFKSLQESLKNNLNNNISTIVIPAGTCGLASGASDLIHITKQELLAKKLTEKIRLRITGCHGFCQMEPSILIEPQRTFYPRVGTEKMAEIIDAVSKGDVCKDLLFADQESGEIIEKQDDIPFFNRQKRTILSNNEKIDPTQINNYLEAGGYSAILKMFERNNQQWLIEEIKSSALRGRGGAGFPTGLKWEMLAEQSNGKGKIIVCNADEGDPGAYMDRSLLEGNPHLIIEGMIIGAFATDSIEGIIYVRNEYPLAIKNLAG
jgi:NADH-quinone oxidoreductase subunit F